MLYYYNLSTCLFPLLSYELLGIGLFIMYLR